MAGVTGNKNNKYDSVDEDTRNDDIDSKKETNFKDRLFDLRMKINQGRKSNKTEVEEEYKRFSDPKYEQRQRYMNKRAGIGSNVEAADEEISHNQSSSWKTKEDEYMNQTAEQAEWEKEKAEQKQKNMATFGWHALTSEATHRAYEKRLKKLPTRIASGNKGADSLEADPLAYGSVGASVTAAGLNRLSKDVEERQIARQKVSNRRKASDAVDVDYINEKNAAYNKKLKRSFDKYTVEIRQNLERGTAI